MATPGYSSVNDNAPVFPQHAVSRGISEDLPVGTEILLLAATDDDAGSNGAISYFLHGSVDPDAPLFAIGIGTGIVYVAAPLNADVAGVVHVQVEARDGGAACEVGVGVPLPARCMHVEACTFMHACMHACIDLHHARTNG